ncbi:hypothetical protein RJT34_22542 [Clitoria ternatea]|uniref:Uncharacterized protein n=1 Tax=Clitoria ternatea TaxID=43366 RepID=A0AAN9FR65_CLITE
MMVVKYLRDHPKVLEEIRSILPSEKGKKPEDPIDSNDLKLMSLEVGMMEKNSEKEWELMGIKFLVRPMKDETTRRDKAMK